MTLSWGINKSGELESYNTHEIKAVPVEETVHVEADPVVIGERFVPTKDASEIEYLNFSEGVLTTPVGRKYDSGKLDWTLLPFTSLEDAVRVLMFGAEKYERENWKLVANGRQRYTAACLRHLLKHMDGEEFDPETGLRHTAHAMVNLLFIEWLRKEGK